MVAQTKQRGGRKIPTPTSFGSASPMSTSNFAHSDMAFLHCALYIQHLNILIFKVFHGHMEMATWTWPHGHGRIDMATRTWTHKHEHMKMDT